MLSKVKRLTSSHIEDLTAESRSFHGIHLSIRVRYRMDKQLFAVIASKKVAKTAVIRNRIRRRIYSALRNTNYFKKTHNHPIHCGIFAKSSALNASLATITEELDSLLDKSATLK